MKYYQVLYGLTILVLSGLKVKAFVKLWTFDLLNLTTTTTHPELFDVGASVIRLGRGHIGFSGYANFSIDLDDDVLLTGYVKRSLKKDGPYSKLPFGGKNEKLSAVMNSYYKMLLMHPAQKCCINAPYFKDKFVPPLTKRIVEVKSCVMTTDDLPKIMMEGYYWVTIKLKREFEVNVHILSYVEQLI